MNGDVCFINLVIFISLINFPLLFSYRMSICSAALPEVSYIFKCLKVKRRKVLSYLLSIEGLGIEGVACCADCRATLRQTCICIVGLTNDHRIII